MAYNKHNDVLMNGPQQVPNGTLEDQPSDPQTPSNLEVQDPNKPTPYTLPTDVADQRAGKYQLAIGPSQAPSREDLTSVIQNGGEDALQSVLANKKQLDLNVRKQQILSTYMSNRDPNRGPPDQKELDSVQQLTQQGVNPKLIFAAEYARNMVTSLLTSVPNQTLNNSIAADPELTHQAMDIAQDHITKKEYIQSQLENYSAQWDQMNPIIKGARTIQTMIPFETWFQQAGFNLLHLPGTTEKEYAQNLWNLSPDNFQKQFDSDFQAMWNRSPSDALSFAQLVSDNASQNYTINNLYGALDVASVLPVGKIAGLAKGSKGVISGAKAAEAALSTSPIKSFQNMMKGFVETLSGKSINVSDVAEATGKNELGAVAKAAETIAADNGVDKVAKLKATGARIPSFMQDSDEFLKGEAGTLSKGLANDVLEESRVLNRNRLLQPLDNDQAGAVRLSPAQEKVAVQEALTKLTMKGYEDIEHGVLDVRLVPQESNVLRTNTVEVDIGNNKKTLFDTAKAADTWATTFYKLPVSAYSIEQKGSNYFIRVKQAVDETSKGIRDTVIPTEHTIPEPGILGGLLNKGRIAPEIVGPGQSAQRKATVSAPQQIMAGIKEVANDITSLSKGSKNDLQKVLKYNRDYTSTNALGQQIRGKWYTNVPEFQREFSTIVGRQPTTAEAKAYFSYTMLSDYDWVLRSMNMFRDKSRLGVESVALSMVKEDGTKVTLPRIDGKLVEDVPLTTDKNAGIYFVNDYNKKGTYLLSQKMGAPSRKLLREAIDTDKYKVVQLFDPRSRPLKDFINTDSEINFVVIKNAEFSPLHLDEQLGYAPGGHVEPRGNWYIKQAKLALTQAGGKNSAPKYSYFGDSAIWNHDVEAQANKYSDLLNQARDLHNAGNRAALDTHLQNTLPWSIKDWDNKIAS